MSSTIQNVTVNPEKLRPFYAIGPNIITSAGYTAIDFGTYSIDILSNVIISINNNVLIAQGLTQTQFADFITGLISVLGGNTSIDVGDITVSLAGGTALYGTINLAPSSNNYIITYIAVANETLSNLFISGEGDARVDLYLNSAIVYTTSLTRYTPNISANLDIAILSGTEIEILITCNALATSNYYATLIHG